MVLLINTGKCVTIKESLKTIRHRARNCSSILSYDVLKMKCRNCATLKRNCRSYKKNTDEPDHDGQQLKKQKRISYISYMNPEEISSSETVEQARVTENAGKRAESRAANAKLKKYKNKWKSSQKKIIMTLCQCLEELMKAKLMMT